MSERQIFEALMRKRHGNRHSFELDMEGYYARENVRLAYEFWCLAKGIIG